MAAYGEARRNKDAKSAESDAGAGNKPEPTAAHAGVGAPAESDVEQVESHMYEPYTKKASVQPVEPADVQSTVSLEVGEPANGNVEQDDNNIKPAEVHGKSPDGREEQADIHGDQESTVRGGEADISV